MLSPNARGALLMMASMAAFTINDAFVKRTLDTLPLFQVISTRGAMATTLIFLMAWRVGALDFRLPRRDWTLIVLRSACEIGATYFFLTALSYMPLANVSAVLQVLPLTVTLGAALFFGEQIGWRRMLAIGVGFCGVMLILQPGTDAFNMYALYALAAVLCVTLRDLTTRRMSGQVPSLTVTLIASTTVFVSATAASLTTPWVAMDLWQFALIAGAACFIIGGYHFSVAVMRIGEVSFVAPFRYTSLLWALLLGWVIFGDWPGPLTMLGAAVVVTSGIFMFYRERVVSEAE